MLKPHELPNSLTQAYAWLLNGYAVIPIQPGTKRIVRGFGPTQGVLHDAESVRFWFQDRRANLGVVCQGGRAILDFDDPGVYKAWAEDHPQEAESYTEETPRGGSHVFVDTSFPLDGFEPVKGLEIKRVCLVYPSTVGGQSYTVRGGHLLTVDPQEALHGFGTFQTVKTTPPPPVESLRASCGQTGVSQGIISKVKANFPILSYLAYFEPRLVLTGAGRWRQGRCPWHDDRNPSLWIDSERNLWGCHACPAHGDVVNWHARKLHTQDMITAACDLDRYKVRFMESAHV